MMNDIIQEALKKVFNYMRPVSPILQLNFIRILSVGYLQVDYLRPSDNGAALTPESSMLWKNFLDNREINREFARQSSEQFSIKPLFIGNLNELWLF